MGLVLVYILRAISFCRGIWSRRQIQFCGLRVQKFDNSDIIHKGVLLTLLELFVTRIA